MQHVDLIDDEQSYFLYQLGVSGTFSCDNIPLLWCSDYNLRIQDLSLGKMHITSKFASLDTQPRQTLSKLLSNLGSERLHRRDVDDLEVFRHYSKVGGVRLVNRVRHNVLGHGVENRKHGSVCFTSTSRCANQHVLTGLVCNWIYKTLHPVECLVAFEGALTKAVQFLDLQQLSAYANSAYSYCGNLVFFVEVVVAVHSVWR